jgi:3-deoxy-7-phosphoheptulonate synthase
LKKVVKIGRIAGQYAKPRSCPYEYVKDGNILIFVLKLEQIFSYRGELINDI